LDTAAADRDQYGHTVIDERYCCDEEAGSGRESVFIYKRIVLIVSKVIFTRLPDGETRCLRAAEAHPIFCAEIGKH
jgi:hypothetical protein